MANAVVKVVVAVLLAVHTLLIAIGIGGLVEWSGFEPPWTPYSNPELPRWMLLLQWLLMLIAGVMFIAGYLSRWRLLPFAMLAVYSVMAGVCAVQTFFYLINADRFVDMAIEYAEYTAILLFLFLTPAMRTRFPRNLRAPSMQP
jgi:hypothetical protein